MGHVLRIPRETRKHVTALSRPIPAAPSVDITEGGPDSSLPPSPQRPTKRTAAAYAAGLSLLFILVYGGCNWLTSHRANVSTWYYAFERHIPFVPWMILPYMSIDLFFVAAPFLCRSRTELDTLARRICFAIIVAGICFLLIPLRLAVPYPQTDGWPSALFHFLRGFDQPHNLFPSLHITLLAILANLYIRHTRGPVRAACYVWFSLICISTLLTYQHHLVDVVGGIILAVCCFYFFREMAMRLPVIPDYRIGGYYLAGSLVCLACARLAWPWTAALLWPAISLGVTAAGYFGVGPGIYRKHEGRVPLSARLLLAPSLAGQWVSLLYYRRQCPSWSEVTPHVWIGAHLNRRGAREAKHRGVTAVLDLTAEFSETPEFLDANYCNIPTLDLTGLSGRQLLAAVAFISKHAGKGVVYVHCKVGYSRSSTAVGAYLLASGQAATIEEALAIQRKARPTIIFRPEVVAALEYFSTQERISPPRP